MVPYLVPLLGLAPEDRPRVGGKGASLAALCEVDGVDVPEAWCLTTDAYADALARVGGDPAALAHAPVPDPVIDALRRTLDPDAAWAVRSSATAEDLPTASFAGQHDSYLDVRGLPALVDHVRLVWASLGSERAVAYRRRQGIDPGRVRMAVVIQRLVPAEASGVLFTADPRTGNRRVSVIEAVRGLGDAYVSGRVAPAHHQLREGRILARSGDPILTDAQLARLEQLGRTIEAQLGRPQDIEWCLAGDRFAIVQSRPITTLFPIPDAGDGPRVYVSVSHQQMMTDPMKPLGLSVFQRTAGRPMFAAGGRLFVEISADLASPVRRAMLLGMARRSDPLLHDALHTLLHREGSEPEVPSTPPPTPPPPPDPAVTPELVAATEAGIVEAQREVAGLEGLALLDFLDADFDRFRKNLADPRSMAVIVAAINAAAWLDEHLRAWLDERGVVDALSKSLPDNVGSEMGLALLDVADTIRPHADLVTWLEHAPDAGFLDGVRAHSTEAADALERFLDRFGMRCVGEIDITRPRWREAPTALVPMLLANVRSFEPGEAARRFEAGRLHAEEARRDVLARLLRLEDGARKAADTDAMIQRLRSLMGYREYPKYGMIKRYFVYRQALLREGARLVQAGVIDSVDDLDFLRLEELRDTVRSGTLDRALVAARQEEHAHNGTLTLPRVITSDGETLQGEYHRTGVPPGALVGLAVSAGVVEGRARVIREPGSAALGAGDILVTPFTDPSWTPAFVAIAGLVTEVGGMMTHGAVIAREYGLPAVVAVPGLMERIRDGQRIRVDGTHGWVELVD